MARHARVHFSGGIYHLISRCVGKQFLIEGDAERRKYLELLGRAAAKYDTIILAFCVMSNHVHLVVRAGNDPLERLMKSVHAGFAGWLNRRSAGKRDGAVFSQRYRAILVEEDAYLQELVRYVHNNPVRAKVTKFAADSDWSSHQYYTGAQKAPAWLNFGYVLTSFHPQTGWARRRFEQFVNDGRKEKRRADLNAEDRNGAAQRFLQVYGDSWRLSGPIVGSETFAAKVLEDIHAVDSQVRDGGKTRAIGKRPPTLDELIAVVCAKVGTSPWEFDSQPKKKRPALARKLIVHLWVREFGGKQIDVARKLNTSSASVTRWISTVVENLPDFETLIDELRQSFPSLLEGADMGQRVRYTFEINVDADKG